MRLNLRSRILLFLFLFAFAPLLLAVVINLPLVLDRVELFYRHAFLQDLRADFSDLDQHLASRDEMLRLLAKLPEPGVLVATGDEVGVSRIDQTRSNYAGWINRMLRDQLDINRLQFVDRNGVQQFWLERSFEDGRWHPTPAPPDLPDPQLVARVLAVEQPVVVPTPIRIDPRATHPSREMVVQLLAPLGADGDGPNPGIVVMTIDVGGLARRDSETLWVHADGRYLSLSGLEARPGSAFEEFPGLEQRFADGRIALWEGEERQVIWVPLFRTSDGQALWVGRHVDRRPLLEFETALTVRVLSIIVLLVVAIWLAARWIARRAERIGQRVHEDVRRMLEDDAAVRFDWRGSEELRQLGTSLSQLAETHARDRRNLRAHARELEESSRYKSEFLANVSHELRTPLNSILLLSKLLTEELADSDADTRQKAEVIRDASQDLRELIDDVLDLSRIESGRLEIANEDIDLPRLLDDLVDLMSPQFTEHGLSLEFERRPDAPRMLHSDPARLRQIIKNFLSNAVKFTPEGGVRIRLRRAPAPYFAQIDVADTGVGVRPDQQELIFEAFRQADGSTGRQYSGTGLGLTISRELARLLQGEIRLESSPGAGSTFSVLLPREPSALEIDEAPAPRDTTSAVGVVDAATVAELPRPLAGSSALLIGGGVREQLRYSDLLAALGLDIALADDIDEARETLAEQHTDFVLLAVDHLQPEACASIVAMVDELADRAPACIALVEDAGSIDDRTRPRSGWPAEVTVAERLEQTLTRLRPDPA